MRHFSTAPIDFSNSVKMSNNWCYRNTKFDRLSAGICWWISLANIFTIYRQRMTRTLIISEIFVFFIEHFEPFVQRNDGRQPLLICIVYFSSDDVMCFHFEIGNHRLLRIRYVLFFNVLESNNEVKESYELAKNLTSDWSYVCRKKVMLNW